MPDFRSQSERNQDAWQTQQVEQDYKIAFQSAQKEISDLKTRVLDLETKNDELQSKLSEVITTQFDNIREVRSQIEAGISNLTEDNRRMHALIQSAHDQDLKLVEQMDQNHRERLDNIARLFDQKGLPRA